MIDDLEKCPYCGIMTESPCDEPPPDTCERALNQDLSRLDQLIGSMGTLYSTFGGRGGPSAKHVALMLELEAKLRELDLTIADSVRRMQMVKVTAVSIQQRNLEDAPSHMQPDFMVRKKAKAQWKNERNRGRR